MKNLALSLISPSPHATTNPRWPTPCPQLHAQRRTVLGFILSSKYWNCRIWLLDSWQLNLIADLLCTCLLIQLQNTKGDTTAFSSATSFCLCLLHAYVLQCQKHTSKRVWPRTTQQSSSVWSACVMLNLKLQASIKLIWNISQVTFSRSCASPWHAWN